jgi:hypothetical protein
MGHQVPTPLVPLAERVGCGFTNGYSDIVHVEYNANCLGCHIRNGGSDD